MILTSQRTSVNSGETTHATVDELETLATRRSRSMFETDLSANSSELAAAIRHSSILILGGAGSIGQEVTKLILRYHPRRVVLCDPNENNLVELTRDLRSSACSVPSDFLALPIGMGSHSFSRFIQESKPFDFLLNFAALKHVRSEKCIHSIIQMIDVNVLFLNDIMETYGSHLKNVFSVSSDKAVNPSSFLGASKQAMELCLFSTNYPTNVSTSRFANVAFSDGSLLFGFLRRIQKRQPIAAPTDIRRFFLSHREAGELSVLAAFLGQKEIFIPKLHRTTHERVFADIASDLLDYLGWTPQACGSEDEAVARFDELTRAGKWPCFFSASTTFGEKPFEEFSLSDEPVDLDRFSKVGVIPGAIDTATRLGFQNFVSFAKRARTDLTVGKQEYSQALADLVRGFSHLNSQLSLDTQM